MKFLSLETLKKVFISIAYVSYAVSTILKTQLHVDMQYYEYIFVVIIGVCLKLSQHTEVIEKILHEIPTDDLTFIKNRLDSIVDMSVKSATPPRGLRDDFVINIPYPEDAVSINHDDCEINTHRSIELSNGNILRIRN